MTRRAALAALLPLLATATGATMAKVKPIMEWKGAFCAQKKPSVVTAETPEAWAKVWALIGRPAPAADLDRLFAVAVFAGERPTGGYAISWKDPEKDSPELVRYSLRKPRGMVIQALTQPYAVKLFPKGAKPPAVLALPDE